MFPLPIVDIICFYVGIDAISSFLSKNEKKINIEIFCKNPHAPPSYILSYISTHIDPLHPSYLPSLFLRWNSSVPREYLEEMWDTHSSEICRNESVPEDLLEANIDTVDWTNVSRNDGISDNFIIKHRTRYFDGLNRSFKMSYRSMILFCAGHSRFPPPLVREHMGDAEFMNGYMDSPWISEDILEEYKDSLTSGMWCNLCRNKKAPIGFLLKHRDKIQGDSELRLMETHRVPISFIRERKIHMKASDLNSNRLLPIDDIVSSGGMYPALLKAIYKNENVKSEWLERMKKAKKKIWRGPLSGNPGAPMDFMEKNEILIHWPEMCSNPNVSINLILRNIKKIIWKSLSSNDQFWKRLIEKEVRDILTDHRWSNT